MTTLGKPLLGLSSAPRSWIVIEAMSTKILVGLSLLLPFTACSSDDPGPPTPAPEFTACAADVDYGKNSSVDGIRAFTYENGNLVHETLDDGKDGVLEEAIDYSYDGDDLIRCEYRAIGESGQLELVEAWEYTYDDQGRELTALTDWNGDGVFEAKTEWVRDADGQVLEIHDDEGNDGSIDVVTKVVFDAEGRRSLEQVDHANDGSIDSTGTYLYDDDGRLERFERDEGVDGDLELVTTYTWERHGWLESRSTDLFNDGKVDSAFTYAYADDRHASLELRFGSDDGSVRSDLETYRYDCDGEKPRATRASGRIAEIRAAIRARR